MTPRHEANRKLLIGVEAASFFALARIAGKKVIADSLGLLQTAPQIRHTKKAHEGGFLQCRGNVRNTELLEDYGLNKKKYPSALVEGYFFYIVTGTWLETIYANVFYNRL